MNFSKENQQIWNNFKKCVDERSLESMSKKLYEQLHMYAGFIAHYDFHNFKITYSGFKFLDFVKHFGYPIYPIRIDTEEYRQINELNRMMKEYVKEHESRILYEFENKAIQGKIQQLKKLADQLGYDIMPKGTLNKAIDLDIKIETDGQIALF